MLSTVRLNQLTNQESERILHIYKLRLCDQIFVIKLMIVEYLGKVKKVCSFHGHRENIC